MVSDPVRRIRGGRLWRALAVVLVGVLAIAASALAAPTGTLVKDINPGSEDSLFDLRGTNVAGALFFSACDGTHGCELWKSDGTAAGTKLVKDIYPGDGSYDPHSSGPYELTDVAGELFFTASDATHGRELWKSDGTAAGTRLV